MSFYEDKTCFFELETTRKGKKKYVAVGSNGNILAWKQTKGNEQKWLIVPIKNGRCKLLTVQNGEHMAVGSNGNILRWKSTGNQEQEFTFLEDINKEGWYNIKEFTRNERVAVGSDSNILRWKKTGKDDQIFLPHEVNLVEKPASINSEQEGRHTPGNIPPPPSPDFKNKRMPPEISESYLVGNCIIPSVYIRDPKYVKVDRNRVMDQGLVDQVIDSPYYVLRREQFWSRIGGCGKCEVRSIGQSGQKIEETSKVVIHQATQTTSISTLSMSFSIGGEVAFTAATGSMSTSISKELGLTVVEENSVTTEREVTLTYSLDPGVQLIVVWEMFDKYSLYYLDSEGNVGNKVEEWTISSAATQEHNYAWDVENEAMECV